MAIKFVHTADIHLDSPLKGLERYEGAPIEAIRHATRKAFQQLIALCLEEEVSLLLISGDLYDGDWKDYTTGQFFCKEISRLTRENIQILLVRGNHDAESLVNKHLRLPDGVYQFSHHKPETRRFPDLKIAIHGQSYPKKEVKENLASRYPTPVENYFNIGMLHTGLGSQDSYAPCSSEQLIHKNYHYWALGHIHQREVHCRDPWIVSPGNLQGRHICETGNKGATLVTLTEGNDEFPTVQKVEHKVLDVLRWTECQIDCSGLMEKSDIFDQLDRRLIQESTRAEGRLLAVRLLLTGATAAYKTLLQNQTETIGEIRQLAHELNALGEIWIEKIHLDIKPVQDLEKLAEQKDPLGELWVAMNQLAGDTSSLEHFFQDMMDDLEGKLPSEYFQQSGAIDTHNVQQIQTLFHEASRIVTSRLMAASENQTA